MISIKKTVLGFVSLIAALIVCSRAAASTDVYYTTSENYVGFDCYGSNYSSNAINWYTWVYVYDEDDNDNIVGCFAIDVNCGIGVDPETNVAISANENVQFDTFSTSATGYHFWGIIPVPGWGHYRVEVGQEGTGSGHTNSSGNWGEHTVNHYELAGSGSAHLSIDIGPGS